MTRRDWAQCGTEVEGARKEALRKRVRTELGAEVEREQRWGGYYERTIVRLLRREQDFSMAKYFALLGRRVHVEYRAGDIYLPAVGTLAADSGKSIFLEERFEKSESVRTFRWEIPYQCIVRIKEVKAGPSAPRSGKDGMDIDAA